MALVPNGKTTSARKQAALGKWEWKELTTTEKVLSSFTLYLKDTKTAAGEAEVVCGGTGTGSVGPGKFDRIGTLSLKASNCKAEKVCENVEEVEARDLPWQTELFETEGAVRDKVTEAGGGEPGWKIKCKVPVLGSITDECLTVSGKEGSTLMEDVQSSGAVDALFEVGFGKTKCTQGGAESGEIEGLSTMTSSGGAAIRSGPVNVPHWYSEGARLPESNEAGGVDVLTGTGSAKFKIVDKGTPQEIECTMEDAGVIWNPNLGFSGTASITSVTFTGCGSPLCAVRSELKAKMLPWSAFLLGSNPIKLLIGGMELAIFCEGAEEVKYRGTIIIPVRNGSGRGPTACTASTHTTFMQFAKAPLRTPANNFGELEGEDCIWGATKTEEIITVESP